MTPTLVGILGIALLFAFLILRTPVAFAMLAVGYGGLYLLEGSRAAGAVLLTESYGAVSNYSLIVVPMFILLGNVSSEAGFSRGLYDAAYAWVGRFRGGLASASVIGCALFSAVSGSSVATAVTIGKVALPEMKRLGYGDALATGSVAAGGTLGFLIPPSTGFVIYAILTEQSIGRLFMAGILPGILLLTAFLLTVSFLCTVWPSMGPRGPSTTMSEKGRAFLGAVPILAVVFITIGGIYSGLFSPTEAAGVGAALVILIGAVSGNLGPRAFWEAARSSIVTTASIMLILIAAHLINPFVALSHLPAEVSRMLVTFDLGLYGTLFLILAIYLVLGCFLEGLAMLVLTLPIFMPVVTDLGIDPIWFGVLVVLTLEMGLISPPVGINVFIVKSVARDVPLIDIFRGVMPFWFAMLVTLIILVAVPQLSLWLPSMM